MCPRATAQRGGGGAMAAAAGVVWFGEEEYIDLDLSSCGEFEFRVRRSSAADELPRRGRYKVAPRSGVKLQQEADAGAGGIGGGGGRRSAATVAPLQHSQSAGPAARPRADQGSRPRKAASAWTVRAKLQASRAFFRSLFARTSCSHERCRRAGVRAATAPLGGAKNNSVSKAAFGETKNARHIVTTTSRSSSGSTTAPPTTLRSSIEREKLMDEAELAAAAAAAAVRQRKSFSGVIRWRHAATTTAPARPPPSCSSSSARRSSCSGSGGPALKRCSSARSESERLIQGAIAYCKRSQQQLGLARKSVSDAALCSFLPGLPAQLDSSSAVAYHLY